VVVMSGVTTVPKGSHISHASVIVTTLWLLLLLLLVWENHWHRGRTGGARDEREGTAVWGSQDSSNAKGPYTTADAMFATISTLETSKLYGEGRASACHTMGMRVSWTRKRRGEMSARPHACHNGHDTTAFA
jgi:hypothetical protein